MSNTKIFYNGDFHTMNKERPGAEAMACREGVIIGVGKMYDLADLAKDAELVDLKGGYVFPGFIDTYSAPGLAAFTVAAEAEEDYEADDRSQWLKDCRDYLYDKGVATLCVHGANTWFPVATEGPDHKAQHDDSERPQMRVLENISYRTDFERDISEDYYDGILGSPDSTFLLFSPVCDDSSSVHDAVARLTWQAAENIGREDLGILDPGKRADLTVFDINPFENDMHTFQRIHASMIIVDGEVVYDEEEAAKEEWYDLLVTQMF